MKRVNYSAARGLLDLAALDESAKRAYLVGDMLVVFVAQARRVLVDSTPNRVTEAAPQQLNQVRSKGQSSVSSAGSSTRRALRDAIAVNLFRIDRQ
jgi:hypothetical protein